MKNTLKKLFILFIALVCAFGAFASCKKSKRNFSVVCTVFPQYDWVKQILGDKIEDFDLVYLTDNGVDLHSYQPTVKDIAAISSSDLFIYVGGESDEWTTSALKNLANKNNKSLSLLSVCTLIEEEHDHDEEHADEEHDHEHEADEHVWTSIKNAIACVDKIAGLICDIDSENAEYYKENAKKYVDKLSALDARYTSELAAYKGRTLVFADRFPFAYLFNDYGLLYEAAFSGCSAESEASFEKIAHLAKKIDELNLSVLLVTDKGNTKLADTVINQTKNKNARIERLNSFQSVKLSEAEEKVSYFSISESNLSVLLSALR